MQLDHFFILTEQFAPAAELLRELGLIEGTPNDHPGQGTANRRFFFSNSALELVYIRDATEANEGPGRDLQLPARASDPGASPFGLVLRRDGQSKEPAIRGWQYQPLYFESGTSFLVAENSADLREPLCIVMPDNAPRGDQQVQSQPPFTQITRIRLHVPAAGLSSTLEDIARIDNIEIKAQSHHLMEIEFNHASEGKQRDFRPDLPLAIRW